MTNLASSLALVLALVGCASTPAVPTTLANARPAELAPLEPFGPHGESTLQVSIGTGVRTIGFAGNELLLVEGTTRTRIAKLPGGYDYRINDVVPEDAPGDFYLVGSRSEGTIVEHVTWTFYWSRDQQTFVSRAPAVTRTDASKCDVCDG